LLLAAVLVAANATTEKAIFQPEFSLAKESHTMPTP
jgi:hypothetical protein